MFESSLSVCGFGAGDFVLICKVCPRQARVPRICSKSDRECTTDLKYQGSLEGAMGYIDKRVR